MKHLKVALLSVALITGAMGCSSSYDPSEQLEAQHEAQLLLEELKAERAAIQAAKKREKIEQLPDWYLEPPKNDGYGVYGIGVGESSKYAIAMKRGKLAAEFAAAQQMSSELSGLVKSYSSDSQESINDSYSETIEKLVSGVAVVGYTVVKSELIEMGNKYHSYYLIHLPYNEFNKALKQSEITAESAEISLAFKELERKVKESEVKKSEVK